MYNLLVMSGVKNIERYQEYKNLTNRVFLYHDS